MIAVFYDRKNQREVTSDQIMKTNVCESYAAVDDEGFRPGTPIKTLTDKYGDDCLMIATRQIGELAYKSEVCPSHRNWDMYCTLNDLVFLRLK